MTRYKVEPAHRKISLSTREMYRFILSCRNTNPELFNVVKTKEEVRENRRLACEQFGHCWDICAIGEDDEG